MTGAALRAEGPSHAIRDEARPNLMDSCFGLLVVFLPFLQQYSGAGDVVSLGELLLAPFIAFYLVVDRASLGEVVDRSLLWFYILSITLSVIGGFIFPYFSYPEFWTLAVRLVFYALLILVARRRFDWRAVKKVYLSAVTVAAVYLIIQYVYHEVFGGYLPIVVSDDLVFAPERTFETWTDKYQWFFRPSSLFLEPSYYSLFTLPALVTFAMDDSGKSLPRFMLLVVTYLLSSANSGLLAAVVVLVAFFAFKEKGHLDYIAMIAVLAIVICYLPFHSVEWISSATDRLSSGGTLDNRVLRGFICFDMLDPFHKMVGVGLNNLGSFMDYYGLTTGFDDDGLNYCASWLQTLNYSGIIGFASLVAYFAALYKKCAGRPSRTLWVVLAIVMAYESILFSYRFAFLVILLEGFARSEGLDLAPGRGDAS